MASRGLRTAEEKEAGATGGTTALGLVRSHWPNRSGYKADIVFLDLSNINFVPLNDVANQVVNCEDSSAVESVMIGGRMTLQNRRFTDIDWDKIKREAEAASERLRGVNAQRKERMDTLEEFVGLHCIGLSREPYHIQRRIDGFAMSRRGQH